MFASSYTHSVFTNTQMRMQYIYIVDAVLQPTSASPKPNSTSTLAVPFTMFGPLQPYILCPYSLVDILLQDGNLCDYRKPEFRLDYRSTMVVHLLATFRSISAIAQITCQIASNHVIRFFRDPTKIRLDATARTLADDPSNVLLCSETVPT